METSVYSYHPLFKMYYNYITRKTTEFVVYTYTQNYPTNHESNYAHNGCEN